MGAFRKNGCGYFPLFLTVLGCLVVLASMVPVAWAAEYSLSSRSYLYLHERDNAIGPNDHLAPLYEYLSLDVWDLKEANLSFHSYGWGRVDLADASAGGRNSGDISSAYLQYRYPTGNGQAKLGRFFLAEGTTTETLDGLFLKGTGKGGFGASFYAGNPVENSIIASGGGNSLVGGRVFYVRPGLAEAGFGYLFENGDFQGKNREEAGGDLWVRFAPSWDLTGKIVYNLTTSELASHRVAFRLVPVNTIDLELGTEGYRYDGLFQKSLHPAFLPPSANGSDKVRKLFADCDWQATERLSVQAGVKRIHHDADDPGDAAYGELGFRLQMEGVLNLLGFSAALQTADLSENEYRELRGWLMGTVRKWSFSLDALTYLYEVPVNGVDTSTQIVGSAGWKASTLLSLSGDVRYTRSPRYAKDLTILLRADFALDGSWGGK
ncbi:hypothetical protein BMS3Abin14_01819 [bacterium BMS3Abin14]|nr:hypothetical protein BMS3Abin14_01819 [bacterium BMS3Abin14]